MMLCTRCTAVQSVRDIQTGSAAVSCVGPPARYSCSQLESSRGGGGTGRSSPILRSALSYQDIDDLDSEGVVRVVEEVSGKTLPATICR